MTLVVRIFMRLCWIDTSIRQNSLYDSFTSASFGNALHNKQMTQRDIDLDLIMVCCADVIK